MIALDKTRLTGRLSSPLLARKERHPAALRGQPNLSGSHSERAAGGPLNSLFDDPKLRAFWRAAAFFGGSRA